MLDVPGGGGGRNGGRESQGQGGSGIGHVDDVGHGTTTTAGSEGLLQRLVVLMLSK